MVKAKRGREEGRTYPRLAYWLAESACPFPEGKGMGVSLILSAGADIGKAKVL
jgi:hypothetical protein